ncbi:pyridoxal phosphate-dependent transferase [Fomes fomentarius]|nr:pyridoxal phosphate-dependent transferase [Fomes fomentarius]
MSPTAKSHRNLKVNVPRHDSQRIGPLLTASLEIIAHQQRVRVDIRQTALEPTSALAQAIESASEWNSLLMTARAEQGPQWDVGTQQFQVDGFSDLYYDPTPLREYLKVSQQRRPWICVRCTVSKRILQQALVVETRHKLPNERLLVEHSSHIIHAPIAGTRLHSFMSRIASSLETPVVSILRVEPSYACSAAHDIPLHPGQYAALTAFIEPDDEVIIFKPFFDQYLPSIAFHGGKCVYAPLHPSTEPARGVKIGKKSWNIDFDELRKAITAKNKMIVLNSPHNPVGKVFTRSELEKVAHIAEEHDLIVMSDEVYESLVFDGPEHVRFASLPGMWDRTITVGSAGKLFTATGWRIGWLVGPLSLIGPTLVATTRIVFCSNSPLQDAAAAGLEQARAQVFRTSARRVLTDAFEKLGLNYTWPEGAYFVLLNISRVRWPEDYPFPPTMEGRGRDFKFGSFSLVHLLYKCADDRSPDIAMEGGCEERRKEMRV